MLSDLIQQYGDLTFRQVELSNRNGNAWTILSPGGVFLAPLGDLFWFGKIDASSVLSNQFIKNTEH